MNNPTLTKYLQIIKKLKIDKAHGIAPHKPILLLSIFNLIEKGIFNTNRIYLLPELVAEFKDNWTILVTTNHHPNFLLPFFHLQSDKIWTVKTKQNENLKALIKSFKLFDEVVDYGHFPEELFSLLLDRNNLLIFMNLILDTYFSETKQRYINEKLKLKSTLQKVEEDFFNSSIEANLHYYDSIDEEEKFVRGGLFKRLVPKVYEYRCAITGMKVITLQDYNMVDACHIVPFNISKDDTISNGIALCPNMHRAFDRGIISLDNDFCLICSKSISEDEANDYSLRKLEGRKINLPFDKKLYPDPEKLKWHREKVFKG